MPDLTETAYAKVNLALHIRRRRGDGYHELETLFAFANDGDLLSARAADGINLTVTGRFRKGLSTTDNLVVRAAELVKSEFKIQSGATIVLDKRLPVASGIGGGSADAAATARLLRRLWAIEVDDRYLEELLAPLGADIPACVRSRTAIGEGTGTDLRAVADAAIRGKPLLLVNPLQPVATAMVFKAWDGEDHGGIAVADTWQATLSARNDLQSPAISICPPIRHVLDALAQTNADLVRMSGSGATCFAIYDSGEARDAALSDVGRACPEWWTMASSLR